MGIVNVTPDSFSDGGRFLDARSAVEHGLRLAEEGADLLDVGGESTRPGAPPVSAAEERARIEPVVRELVEKHLRYTGSTLALALLDDWEAARGKFVKVFPHEYKRALGEMFAKRAAARAAQTSTAREVA